MCSSRADGAQGIGCSRRRWRVTPTSVIHYTPHWIGRHEHSINIAHVASVRIDTKLLFADVFIETTGGQSAIQCRGHHKGDALEIKRLIEQFQTAYYRTASPPGTARTRLDRGTVPKGPT